MLEVYRAQLQIPAVCGDVSQVTTVAKIWSHCPGSTIMSSGIACQPYSRLGDGRGGMDARALS